MSQLALAASTKSSPVPGTCFFHPLQNLQLLFSTFVCSLRNFKKSPMNNTITVYIICMLNAFYNFYFFLEQRLLALFDQHAVHERIRLEELIEGSLVLFSL